MGVKNVPNPGKPQGPGGDLAAVGCWGGCWSGGCWGGCWPGVTAEPELIESVARALGDVPGAPPQLGEMLRTATRGVQKGGQAKS